MTPRSAKHALFMGDQASLLFRALLCLVAVVLSVQFTSSASLRALDNRLQDAYTEFGPQQPAPPGVVVVDISESSLAALGPWPWSRTVLAELSTALRQRGARVQVWDLLLPESAAGDENLSRTLAQADVVLGQVLVTDPQVAQPPQEGRLRHAGTDFQGLCSHTPPVTGHLGVAQSLKPATVGHVGATPDADGRLRRLPAVICHEGRAHPQMALAAAQALSPTASWALQPGRWPWQPAQTLVLGGWRFPLDAEGWMRVPYARAHQAWHAVSVEQVLDPTRRLPELQGSVVLIGSTALGLADIVNTPFSPIAPGVSVHAELVAAAAPVGLLGAADEGAPRWAAWPQGQALASALLTLALGLLLVLRLWPQAHTRGSVVVSSGVLVLPLLLAPLSREAGWLMPALPAAAALLFQATATWLFNVAWLRRQSLLLARHLQGFMPAALALEIAGRNPTGDSLGHAEHGTVMGIRIEGLERWQASVAPIQALGLIHGLHATAQSAAASVGGRLEQAQGHTLFVAWPASQAEGAAQQALQAAQRCMRELQPLLERNESESHPLSMNIAIESGPYLHGVVGHADSRRAILLGPAVADVQGMLELSTELASPVLLGPKAAVALRQEQLQRLGSFVLPAQAQAKSLFRPHFSTSGTAHTAA
jgi:adenylate cyclase